MQNELSEEDKISYQQFKRKMHVQAAHAQVKKLEYTFIDAAAEKGGLRRACQDCERLGLGGVCVLPCFVKPCVRFLGADPKTSIVACVSYPYGADTTDIKCKAVKRALKDGADEAEVSAPLAYIKDGNWGYVRREFKKLKKAVKGRALRISVDIPMLTKDELSKFCSTAAECEVDSVKAFSLNEGGVDFGAIEKIKSAVGDKCGVKAEGVASIADLNLAVDMGADVAGSKNAADIAGAILFAASAEKQ